MNRRTFLQAVLLVGLVIVSQGCLSSKQVEPSKPDSWVVDSSLSWVESKDSAENIEIKDGLVRPERLRTARDLAVLSNNTNKSAKLRRSPLSNLTSGTTGRK